MNPIAAPFYPWTVLGALVLAAIFAGLAFLVHRGPRPLDHREHPREAELDDWPDYDPDEGNSYARRQARRVAAVADFLESPNRRA